MTKYLIRKLIGWDYLDDPPLEGFPPLCKEGRQRDAFGTVWQVEQMGICRIAVECHPVFRGSAYFRVGTRCLRRFGAMGTLIVVGESGLDISHQPVWCSQSDE